MPLMYEMTGYDRQIGPLAVSYDVPEQKIALVKKIAESAHRTMGSAHSRSAPPKFLKSPTP
jgi:hypothetical protein